MSYRFGIAQINPKLGDVEANLALYEEKLRQARDKGVELLLFPELTLTGYFLRDMVPNVAVRLSSRVIQHLKGLSKKIGFVAGMVTIGFGGT